MQEKNIRQQIRFTGRVQGVGFRYTARNAASALCLTGWVRNEYDGSVTMQIQGDLSAINAMLEMIENASFIEIDGMYRQEISVVTGETCFHIKY